MNILLPACCCFSLFSVVWIYDWHVCSELQLALFCICPLEGSAGLPWNLCTRFVSKIRLYVLVHETALQPASFLPILPFPPAGLPSDCLFPLLPFLPAAGQDAKTFDWESYLEKTKSRPVPARLFNTVSAARKKRCVGMVAVSKEERKSSGCHRMVEVEGTSGGHLVQHPCSSRVTYSRLPRTISRQLLNISMNGDSTTSLGNLCQCSVALTVKSVS